MNETIQYWELITAFLLPLVLSLVMQKNWTSATKAVVMFLFSALIVMGQLYIRDELNNWEDPVSVVLRVVAFTIAFYQGLWKPTGVAPKIEDATSAPKTHATV